MLIQIYPSFLIHTPNFHEIIGKNSIRKRFLYLFDTTKKDIDLTLQVTKLCMVSGGEVSVDSSILAPVLRHWQGLLVVGTAHGTLHLLDLALDLGCEYICKEVKFSCKCFHKTCSQGFLSCITN